MDSKLAAPPLQGSAEDQAELQLIQRAYEIGLPIVQQLRRDPDYTERDVYGSFSDDHKTHRLTSGPLSGSRGLGLQVSDVVLFASVGLVWASLTSNCRHASNTEPLDPVLG
jgi:hypothetical protein